MGLTQRVRSLEKRAGDRDRQRVVIVCSLGKTDEELQAEIAQLEATHHPEIVLIDDGDLGPFREVADREPNTAN